MPKIPFFSSFGPAVKKSELFLPITFAMPDGPSGTGVMLKITREAHGFSAKVISMVAIYSCKSVRDPDLDAQLKNALASKAQNLT